MSDPAPRVTGQDGRGSAHARAHAPLIEWLMERDLLRGPFAFADYWASVLDLAPETESEAPLVDRRLFRVGLDRPDLELPRRRFYALMYLVGPLLLPFRSLRRLGRYRVRFRRELGDSVMAALDPYRLDLVPDDAGRVDVAFGGQTLAEGLVDPRRIAGFTSLFLVTYKLAIASLLAIVAVGALGPWLLATDRLADVLPYWIPIGYPLTAALMLLVFRDWVTAILGAVPIIAGRYLLGVGGPQGGWGSFAAAMAGLFALYVAVDWLFVPRPVPPVLMLYRAGGSQPPYPDPHDGPYWLEGRTYWVWRYLMLAPAELNKFWERDWERIEIWIRADGERAGALEWVVTDAHYRELWIPYDRLGSPERLDRQRERALEHARGGDPGVWLVEVDAHPVFHTPYIRGASFIPEENEVHVQSVAHLVSSLFSKRGRDDPDDYIPALDRLRVEEGEDVLGDLPEVIVPLAAREMLATPWRYWRYPLGAQRRRSDRLYDRGRNRPMPPASDPRMQIKAERPARET